MLIIASVILFVVSLQMEPTGLATFAEGFSSIWVAFFLSAVLSTVFGQMIYNYAIGRVGAATASIFLNRIPYFLLLVQHYFFRKRLSR